MVGSNPPGAWLTRRSKPRGGGSSRILRKALAALWFISSAQSTTTTRHPPSAAVRRSEEHTSELQSLMRISYAVFCLKKKKYTHHDSAKHYCLSSNTRFVQQSNIL